LFYDETDEYAYTSVAIFSVEKDPHDTTQKAKESQDTSHKILELQKKLDFARSQVSRYIV